NPMSDRRVDDQRPERDERDVWTKPHPLNDRSGNQGGGDDGERPLIREKQHVRNRPLRIEAYSAQKEILSAPEPSRRVSKCDRIAEEGPRQADKTERGEAHHQRVERVLGAYHPAVKKQIGRAHV